MLSGSEGTGSEHGSSAGGGVLPTIGGYRHLPGEHCKPPIGKQGALSMWSAQSFHHLQECPDNLLRLESQGPKFLYCLQNSSTVLSGP